ncbi:MAG TPA: hypothetical protein VF183_12400 [Acidimicrobiales bacterium]
MTLGETGQICVTLRAARARDLDVSALVSREGPLAVVVIVSVNGRSHATTDEET